MKVSIIIPLFNKAPYVRRALDSIAAQSLADFEVIVIDDGSTDDGGAIVADYADPRCRLIREANAGPGAARNTGIAHAQGELIAFLDADDEWLPTYLEESVRLLEGFGPQVAAVTSGYFEYPDSASTEDLWRKRGLTNGVQQVQANSDPRLVVSMLAYMSPCSTVARREAIQRWQGFYARQKCLFGEDAFLWLKVLLNHSVAFNLTPLVRFHREASGLSRNLNGVRPIEPFLTDPDDLVAACPSSLRALLDEVLAIRAAKTACVLGYWGHWREAKSLMERFTSAKNWRLPYYLPGVLCSTPAGAVLGRTLRSVNMGPPR